MFLVFWPKKACGLLAPRPGIKPAPPALEGEVLSTGPPGKSPLLFFLKSLPKITEKTHLRIKKKTTLSSNCHMNSPDPFTNLRYIVVS